MGKLALRRRRAAADRLGESKNGVVHEVDGADISDLWRAYELAQKHYDADLQLFSARMNLFLVIQSGLLAVIVGAGDGIRSQPIGVRADVALFGLALCMGWILVAFSSYAWIKTWRAHLMAVSLTLEERAAVSLSSLVFERSRWRALHPSTGMLGRLSERLPWLVRPTLVICCLPLLFVAGWIYIGWFA